ncbi:MAG: ferrochelatase [Alphaproteobacteria bacterium]
MNKKIAFVLMNYGGPQHIDEVEGYLKNIFKDPAILQAPFFIRLWLSYRIAKNRGQKSRDIFAKMGGKSPINDETLKQVKAIEVEISHLNPQLSAKGFMIQRYAKPFAKDVMGDIVAFNPDKIILLPMYPQFSNTTTESSLKDFIKHAPKKLWKKIETLHYFYTDKGWQNYFINSIFNVFSQNKDTDFHVLYSAHSIPKFYVDKGDIYERQVNDCVRIIHEQIEDKLGAAIPHCLAWQSKVGRMRWLAPSVEETIRSLNDTNMIVVPLSFVAENSETLVELDMDMKDIAIANGTQKYIRIPTPNADSGFIADLAQHVVTLSQL